MNIIQTPNQVLQSMSALQAGNEIYDNSLKTQREEAAKFHMLAKITGDPTYNRMAEASVNPLGTIVGGIRDEINMQNQADQYANQNMSALQNPQAAYNQTAINNWKSWRSQDANLDDATIARNIESLKATNPQAYNAYTGGQPMMVAAAQPANPQEIKERKARLKEEYIAARREEKEMNAATRADRIVKKFMSLPRTSENFQKMQTALKSIDSEFSRNYADNLDIRAYMSDARAGGSRAGGEASGRLLVKVKDGQTVGSPVVLSKTDVGKAEDIAKARGAYEDGYTYQIVNESDASKFNEDLQVQRVQNDRKLGRVSAAMDQYGKWGTDSGNEKEGTLIQNDAEAKAELAKYGIVAHGQGKFTYNGKEIDLSNQDVIRQIVLGGNVQNTAAKNSSPWGK